MKTSALAGTGIAAAGLILASLTGMPRAAADNPVCFADGCAFYSPSRYINCEMNWKRTSTDTVFCDVGPNQSVSMDPGGVYSVCSGDGCVGNAGEGTPTLAYGQTAAIGPFNCLSAVSGVTCTAASGRGFTASKSGINPVG